MYKYMYMNMHAAHIQFIYIYTYRDIHTQLSSCKCCGMLHHDLC